MLFDDFEDEDELVEEGSTVIPREGLHAPRESAISVGHETIEKDLLEQIEKGRLPHALIFAGPEGIGKATFAYRLVRYLFAHGKAKDDTGPGLFGEALPAEKPADMFVAPDHPDFRKVASGGHPDLLTVEREFDEKRGRYKGGVDVAAVRRIAPFMRMTAAMGGWRIAVVDDADSMSRSAQNALLKILEEPPPQALLILIAHRPGLMVPTIRSRSRMISFTPLSPDHFAKLIREDHPDLTTREMDMLYAIADGSVGQGLRLISEGGLEAVDKIMGLLHDWPRWDWPQIHALADVMSRPGQEDSLQAFQDVLLWIVQSMLQAKARGRGLEEPLAHDALSRMLAQHSLQQWIDIHDGLKTHLDTAKHANLDRRHTVLGAFAALAPAA